MLACRNGAEGCTPESRCPQCTAESMVEAVILDQFSGPSPYSLSQEPLAWADFLDHVRAGLYDGSVPWAKGKIMRLPADFKPHMATTLYREVDSKVAVWKYKWDSSG